MRAACRAAVELALLLFGGCTVTRQQYPESFGAEGAAQCSHRLARPLRPLRPPPRARRAGAAAVPAGGSFGGSAPDGGRFTLKLQFSLLPRHEPQPPRAPTPEAAACPVPQGPPPEAAFPRHPRPSAVTLGPPHGREFRRIRTRWREISAEDAVFPPSSSASEGPVGWSRVHSAAVESVTVEGARVDQVIANTQLMMTSDRHPWPTQPGPTRPPPPPRQTDGECTACSEITTLQDPWLTAAVSARARVLCADAPRTTAQTPTRWPWPPSPCPSVPRYGSRTTRRSAR